MIEIHTILKNITAITGGFQTDETIISDFNQILLTGRKDTSIILNPIFSYGIPVNPFG
jgi:hypothetical protein